VFGVAWGIAIAITTSLGAVADGLGAPRLVSSLFGAMGWMLFYPFGAALVVMAYYDQRIRNEGLDLEAMTECLTPAPTAPPATLPVAARQTA
jgi:hypothetical protein